MRYLLAVTPVLAAPAAAPAASARAEPQRIYIGTYGQD